MYTVIAVRFILYDRMELAIKRERKLYFLHTWNGGQHLSLPHVVDTMGFLEILRHHLSHRLKDLS